MASVKSVPTPARAASPTGRPTMPSTALRTGSRQTPTPTATCPRAEKRCSGRVARSLCLSALVHSHRPAKYADAVNGADANALRTAAITDAPSNAAHRGSRPVGVVAPRRTRETARPAQHSNHAEAVHDHCGGIPSKSGCCVCNCCECDACLQQP